MSLSKSAIIEKAQKLVLKGKIKQAIAEWKKLAAENPNDGNTYNAIGDLYLKSKDKINATGAFIKAADAFQAAAFELKSIALYKKALKVDPSKIEIHEKLAVVYAERGLIGNAIDDYLKVAKHYYKNGNFRGALAVYRKLSGLDPENLNIRLEIAEMCEKQDVIEEAIEEYKKLVGRYDEKNMPDEAAKIRQKLNTLDPTYASQQKPAEERVPEVPLENPPEPKHPGTEAENSIEERNLSDRESSESAQGFLAPEAEPLLQEQTIFPSEESLLSKSAIAGQSTETSDTAQLENAMTEAEVYVQYGLIDKAIAQLKSLTTSFPSALKPHLKLKEIYTQQGMAQEAIATCHYLVEHYTSIGDEAAKNAILEELKSFENQDDKGAVLPTAAQKVETNTSYFDDEAGLEKRDDEAESFGEAILNADSLSDQHSEEPTLTAIGEDVPDKLETAQNTCQDTSPTPRKDHSQTLEPAEDGAYVDLNTILSEGFEDEEDEIEGSLEKSFRNLQESHEGHDTEEAETQYDLGIAYKEMGMLSEAMKAFELGALGEERFEDANIMLATCYREEGSTPKAVQVIERALSSKGNETGQFIALKYELALLYEKLGDKQFKTLYQEIFDTDPSFRDIAVKYRNSTSKDHTQKKSASKKTKDRVSHL